MTTRSASARSHRRRCRDPQLHLRPCANLAPHRHFSADQCGTFRHAAESVVSLDSLRREHLLIDALAIVTDPQAELLVVVADLSLDLPGVGVPERVAQGFRRDLVDLVTNDRAQISRVSLDADSKCRAASSTRSRRELVAKHPDCHREIVAFDGRRSQALHRVTAFGDRLRSVFNRTIQFLFRVCRALRQQVRRRLESQQQTVEALQQRVVQLPGDSCPLPNARLERHVELVMQLQQTQLVTCPEQRQKHSHARGAKPCRAPPRRQDLQAQRHAVFIPYPAIVRALNAQRVIPGGQRRESCDPSL